MADLNLYQIIGRIIKLLEKLTPDQRKRVVQAINELEDNRSK